ncbi:hypothetical protein FGIG_11257 [Fasciola gigantica]|uniref:Uncharacterized protein n=1 Tax=Fasciola gigantica TaxID=46835 RepID=A0A504Y5W8_FASGI|nr:hypothetical protein FGIG_11257 [Fasciola gigantica]
MTSHRTRMQYEQQRQGGFSRNDSASSLRSADPLRTPSGSLVRGHTRTGYAEPSGSVISGSYVSSKPRSHLGGAAASVARNYENVPDYSGRPESVRSISFAEQRSLDRGTPSVAADRASHLGSMASYQPSTMMGKSVYGTRSLYGASQLKMSRSLKASKASLATYKSGRTTIQAEHHDRKVQREINSVKFGRARKLYWISVICFVLFLLVLFVGLLITCLRHIYMNIILSTDVGEMTGPILIAGSFLFFGLGMKFYYDAYRIGSEERKRIKYKAASPSTVAVTTVSEPTADDQEKLVSGQTSKDALTRAPIGSRTTLVIP